MKTKIGIIGCGPWGLNVLERLIFHLSLRNAHNYSFEIHVIDPNQAGTGVYSELLPDYLLLNTECQQINLFGSVVMNREASLAYETLSFYEWLLNNGYIFDDYGNKREIQPTDFVPRKWLGRYLNWVYKVLLAHLPDHIQVVKHSDYALRIMNIANKEIVSLQSGIQLECDFVYMTVGHAQSVQFGWIEQSPYQNQDMLDAFPHSRVQAIVQSQDKVILAGMGLVAIDVISYLTVGMGGKFKRRHDGSLVYEASGREPIIYQYSRSGLPYLARPLVTDQASSYEPRFLTRAFIDGLKRKYGRLDFREQILPIVWKEMSTYYESKQVALGEGEGFAPEQSFFGGMGSTFADGTVYQSSIVETIRADIRESLRECSKKSAIELIRVLRDLFRFTVDFNGLTEASYIDFRQYILPHFYRMVVGPPPNKLLETIALVEAGVLHHNLGPNPVVSYASDIGKWTVTSQNLKKPVQFQADHAIRGFTKHNDLANTSSVLMANLLQQGRVKPYDVHDPSGGIDFNESFHPINCFHQPENKLYVLGLLTDGKRNFNLYIPSPHSRARAIVDADQCVQDMMDMIGNEQETLNLTLVETRPVTQNITQ